MRKLARTLIAALALLSAAQLALAAEPALEPWDEAVYADIRQRFGEDAEKRMRMVYQIASENLNEPVESKLRIVNRAMNNLPWIADQQKYSSTDYWATPLETIATFGGDCEDIAIAKFVMLRLMRVPEEHLHLAYVKIRATGEAHMVLVYAERTGVPPAYVLDHYEPEMLEAGERKDLVAVYAIDAGKQVRVISDVGGDRTVVSEADNVKHAKLDLIKQRIAEERANLVKLNGGRSPF